MRAILQVGALAAAALFSLSGGGARAPEPDSADPDWLARAQRDLAAREYGASRTERGLQAPNRAHGLRTYFTPEGIRVQERTAAGEELLGLALTRFGRGAALAPVGTGEVRADGARVEIARGADLVEWFENSPAGLEQGFTLARRPEGAGELVLELDVRGAAAALRGDRVVLRTSAGRRLEYGQLHAEDASGRALPSRFEVASADRVRLAVDDAGADYPIVIDPLLIGTADAELESDISDAQFGHSVAGAGDVNGDGYDDVVVGAPNFDAGQGFVGGAAFVHLGSAAGIGTVAASAFTRSGDHAWLARTVAGAGDIDGDGYADVIIGQGDQSAWGRAFLLYGGAMLGQAAILQSGLDQPSTLFGVEVAGAGDVNGDGYDDVIVGAPWYDAGQTDEGAAFLYLGGPTGIPSGGSEAADAQLESDQAGALFGVVDGAGDLNGDGYDDVIVGAPSYDAGQTNEGAAFVFLGSASGIGDRRPATAATRIETNWTVEWVDLSVAGAGDVNGDGYDDVIVGATGLQYDPEYDVYTSFGAAFVYHGSAQGVPDGDPDTAATRLEPGSVHSVDGAGDVNGDGYDDVILGDASSSAAYVFHGSPTGIPDGSAAGAATTIFVAALSAAGAGDVNGDGYDDVIIGAPNESDEYSGPLSAAHVYHGGAGGIPDGSELTATATLHADRAGTRMGQSVGGAGDVNGDGYDDVVVGAPGSSEDGAAFVFHGSPIGVPSGSSETAARIITGIPSPAYLGESVAGAGDVNGDGAADVIVGAPDFTPTSADPGVGYALIVLPEPPHPLALALGGAMLAALARRRSAHSG